MIITLRFENSPLRYIRVIFDQLKSEITLKLHLAPTYLSLTSHYFSKVNKDVGKCIRCRSMNFSRLGKGSMALIFMFLMAVVPFTISTELEIWRKKQFDSVIWDGDCGKINGNQAECLGDKCCQCKKIIKMNGIETILNGTPYPRNDGFLKCLYYYRETGQSDIPVNIPSGQRM